MEEKMLWLPKPEAADSPSYTQQYHQLRLETYLKEVDKENMKIEIKPVYVVMLIGFLLAIMGIAMSSIQVAMIVAGIVIFIASLFFIS